MKKSKELNENNDAGQSGEESSGNEEEKKSESASTTRNRSGRMKGSSKLISISKGVRTKVYLFDQIFCTTIWINIKNGLVGFISKLRKCQIEVIPYYAAKIN